MKTAISFQSGLPLHFFILFLAIFATSAGAATHYVAAGGGNEAPYTNWEMAAHSIQAAMDVATAGGVVVVSNGVYEERLDFGGKDLEVKSLYEETGDRSVIEGTVIDAGGLGRAVRFGAGVTAASKLSGFTIRGGHATGGFPNGNGGGIACLEASPRLEHLVIRGNRSDSEGGGLYLSNSGSELTDVRLEGNEAASCGAGMRASGSSVTLERVVAVSNVSQAGSAVFFYHTSGTMKNSLLEKNEATGEGGGALYFDGCSPVFENVTIRDNRATGDGEGGAMNVSYMSKPVFRNCIIWSNYPQEVYFNADWYGMNVTLEYSDVRGGSNGVVTLGKGPVYWRSGQNAEPEYVSGEDARLQEGSPCRDAGTNQGWMATATDLGGNPRLVNDRVDLGAYEYEGGSGVTVTAPTIPGCAASALVGAPVEATTGGSTSSDGEDPEYRFDWGDGSYSEWTLSGVATHAWSVAGTKEVRAQARSSATPEAVSVWSASALIEIEALPPATHYVAAGGGNEAPYTNWEMAAHSIQAAMDVATAGGVVVVSNGVYEERLDFGGKDLEVKSLYEETGDRSVIEGTVIDAGGLGRAVRFGAGVTAASKLSGFTIRGGHATGGFPNGNGGGIACLEASPRLEHLVIRGNRSDSEGGGLYLSNSGSELTDVRLEGNEAASCGAGMRASGSSVTLERVVAVSNVSQAGSAVFFYHTSGTMKNSLLEKNEATGEGGGALYFDGCSPVFENVTIRDNRATGDGEGGAMNVSYMSKPVFRNCIIWSNYPQEVYFNADWYGMNVTLEYSDVRGGSNGVVTLGKGPVYWRSGQNAEPEYVSGEDARLQEGSPCRDAGTNQGWMATATDLGGNPRLVNDRVDLGAYEYASTSGPLGRVSCTLEPEEAILQGAQWRMALTPDGEWQDSGAAVTGLAPGIYTVEFKNVTGWITPAARSVTLATDGSAVISARYEPAQLDIWPPAVVAVFPPDGYVTTSNKLWMMILATDNVAVARVTVNGAVAEALGPSTFVYEVKPLNGQYHPQLIVANDIVGNPAAKCVWYAQSGKIRLTALWIGYWRVRNPFDEDFPYRWYVKENPDENGSGLCLAHRDAFFTTSLGAHHVVLTDTNGVIVDEKGWSPHELPEEDIPAAYLDSDLDGLLNMDEEIAGSDPEDSGSCFEIGGPGAGGAEPQFLRGSSREAADGFVYTWWGASNSLYTLEASTNLSQWVPLPGYEGIRGPEEAISYTNGGEGRIFFLRLKAERAP